MTIDIETITYNEYKNNFHERCIKYTKSYLETKPKDLLWCTNEFFIKLYEYCLTLTSKESLYKVFYLIDYLESLLKEEIE